MLSPGQDIPGRLLAQQKSLAELQQYLTGREEKKQELTKTLKELEMKLAELKFRQPPDTTRCCWPLDSHAKQATTLGGRGTCAWRVSQEGTPSFVPLQLPTPPAVGGFLSRVLPQLWSWQSTQSSCAGSRRTLAWHGKWDQQRHGVELQAASLLCAWGQGRI